MTDEVQRGVFVLITLHISDVIKENTNGFSRLSSTSALPAATLIIHWLRGTVSTTIVILSVTPTSEKDTVIVQIRF